MIGAGIGGGVGFIIGTLVFPMPGVGSAIGTMVGGMAGAQMGRHFTLSLFDRLEHNIFKLQVVASTRSRKMMLMMERGDYLPKKHKRAGRIIERSKSSLEKQRLAEQNAKLRKLA